MSRALRKAQKQKELSQKDAEQIAHEDEEVDEDEESDDNRTGVINPFQLLNAYEDEDEEADENEAVELHALPPTSVKSFTKTEEQEKLPKRSKRRSKKSKQSLCKEDDDFDQALAQHAQVLSLTQDQNPDSENLFNLTELLTIDVKLLDPNVEMRRLFGSKIVASERASTSSPRGRMMRGQLTRGRKSVLVPIAESYPSIIKGGLEMELEPDAPNTPSDQIRSFRFVHSKSYRDTQLAFFQCVQSGDPNTLVNLLSHFPFHIDTCLQVSEIMRHQGDHEGSLQLLERALYAFDRAFHPLFNLASGLVRLPFDIPENRPFYLGIYRFIQSLGRRGCWITAFEFNKLLYALAPEEDPYAALLSLDFYALKARNWSYAIKLQQAPWSLILDENLPLPNYLYSSALAKRAMDKEKEEEAVKDLKLAIRQGPELAAGLFRAMNATSPIQFDCLPTHESGLMGLITDLYTFRNKDIWVAPELTSFLRTAALTEEKFKPSSMVKDEEPLPMNVYRHILLLDEQSLLHYLPRNIMDAGGLSFDPLPPEDSRASYIDEYVTHSRVDTTENPSFPAAGMVPGFVQNLLRRLFPDSDGTAGLRELRDEDVARVMQEIEIAQLEEDEARNEGNANDNIHDEDEQLSESEGQIGNMPGSW